MGTDELGGTYAVVVSSIEPSIADIFKDGVCEEMRLLKHDTHAPPQRIFSDVPDGDAVIEYMARIGLIETIDEVDDGSFTGTRSSYKGNLLAWLRVDVDVE